jgi:hypothetical protein
MKLQYRERLKLIRLLVGDLGWVGIEEWEEKTLARCT